MVIALAGRRVDAPNSFPLRFPQSNVELVRERILQHLETSGTSILVCAAACGADLLALDAARQLGIRRRIVLPSAPELFRQSSVSDRPGDWGKQFDEVLAEAKETDELVILAKTGRDKFSATNCALLEEAIRLAADSNQPVEAAVVWDGVPKEATDYTAQFALVARGLGLSVFEISTLR